MNSLDFVNISSYLRVQEKRMISGATFLRAADAPDVQEALRMLSQGSDYDFGSLVRIDDYELLLKNELRRIYEHAHSMTEQDSIVELCACKYDFHNLRAALKASLFPQRTPNPYISVTENAASDLEKLAAGDFEKSELPPHLVEAARVALESYHAEKNPQMIDIVLDKAMFAHMKVLAAASDIAFITDYVEMSIDFYNVKALMRIREMQKGTAFLSQCLVEGGRTELAFFVENYAKAPSAMVPVFYYRYFGDAMRLGVETYERNGNFSQLERRLDNLLLTHLKSAKYITYGPELLFAYLLNKENEIRQVRIVISCKSNGIGAEALKERLRDNYA